MNENLGTDEGMVGDDVLEYENGLGVLEEGEELPEAGEGPEETGENGDSEFGTVPGEELIEEDINAELLQELIAEVKEIKGYLPELVEYEEKENMTLWEKPLSDYTTGEGLSLVGLMLLLAVVIFGMVGGIIKCKI